MRSWFECFLFRRELAVGPLAGLAGHFRPLITDSL